MTRFRTQREILLSLALVAGLTTSLSPAGAQETADFFKKNCSNCHTIGGGRLVGPDLKNVEERRTRDWLLRFVLNPKEVMDAGDPDAQQMLQEFRGVLMPTTPGLTSEKAEALLNLIKDESAKKESIFAGAAQIPDRPFTAAEVEQGRQLFVGAQSFAQSGPACLSCHSIQGATAFGGGRLGPDLTQVFNKLQGRKGLAGWLSFPPTPTMQPLYKNATFKSEEILALVAFLEKANQDEQPSTTSLADRLNFFLLALGCTAGAFALFDWIWRGRFRGVRRPLVDGGPTKGNA